ncbi:FAD-dependent oxidoreductase domain-containing protein 1-like [Halichondria panicea]|uniref:FAD-dependent oxidoreductase domain-containing protein 1-like n=1 Tax=Halichondria panicea TaxID=6063 RepID=UPI00312B84F5
MDTTVLVTTENGNKEHIGCDHFVNAGGPWASQLALMAGIGDPTHSNRVMRAPLPVKPRRRCVFVIKFPDLITEEFPMLINIDGTYLRKEGVQNTFICGVRTPEHLDHDDFELEVDYSLFDEYAWPSIAHRVPAFESLKLQSAWAGYYDYNTLDQNAIIGRHPVINNLVFANGFSGHGIQQSPAVGRAVSEIVLDGCSHSIDLSRFSFERVVNGQPYKEKNIV